MAQLRGCCLTIDLNHRSVGIVEVGCSSVQRSGNADTRDCSERRAVAALVITYFVFRIFV